MSEILQGTTPSLEIKISTDDFLVSDVVTLEWVIKHNGTTTTHSLSDVDVNTTNNSFVYTFTEDETLAMIPMMPVVYQLRFRFADGHIVGTTQMSLQVADLISEEVMTS